MEESSAKAKQLYIAIDLAAQRLKIKQLSLDLDELKQASLQSDFWQDSSNAQNIMQQISKLQSRTEPWTKLLSVIKDITEMVALGDKSMQVELDQQLEVISKEFDGLKETLKLNGPYDDHDAIVSIYAGAGGTDAQDWTQMLLGCTVAILKTTDGKPVLWTNLRVKKPDSRASQSRLMANLLTAS